MGLCPERRIMPDPYRKEPSKRARKRRRDKMMGRALVIAVLILLLFITALVISIINNDDGADVVQSGGTSVRSLPSSSVRVQVPSSSSVPPVSRLELPAATGEFDEAGLPLLLNATHPIPDTYEMDLVDAGEGQSMDAPAAAAFRAMYAAAQQDGIALTPRSGYRTHERQTANYNASIQRYENEGKTTEEAERLTRAYYAIPGTSEHEVGLAMDVVSIEESFENTDAFAWLQEHCSEYGFIFRYHKDTFDITGIAYEPWHYRYVGGNHAKKIEELGITLEEYVEMYANAPGAVSSGVGSSGMSKSATVSSGSASVRAGSGF